MVPEIDIRTRSECYEVLLNGKARMGCSVVYGRCSNIEMSGVVWMMLCGFVLG